MQGSRFVRSLPPVVPYTGPLEPDEPDEPMPVKLKVDAFLEGIKQFELPRDRSYFK